jgi:hypothetical protein
MILKVLVSINKAILSRGKSLNPGLGLLNGGVELLYETLVSVVFQLVVLHEVEIGLGLGNLDVAKTDHPEMADATVLGNVVVHHRVLHTLLITYFLLVLRQVWDNRVGRLAIYVSATM